MNNLKFIIRYILFWLFFFLIGRIVFVLFFSREVFESSFFEIIKIIPKSFSLDISFISYLLVIIVLFMWFFSFFQKGKKLLSKLIFGITSMFLIFSALVNGGEVSLYSEWQTKLKALFLGIGKEAGKLPQQRWETYVCSIQAGLHVQQYWQFFNRQTHDCIKLWLLI